MAVYLIQSGVGGPIKIGYATNPAKRLVTLATASPAPLSVLAVIENGTRAGERWLHQRFANLRIHGEWFRPAEELLAFCRDPSLERNNPNAAAGGTANPVDTLRMTLGLSTDADVAEFTGVIFQAVSAWRKRCKVPSERSWRIADQAVEAGLLPECQRREFAESLWRPGHSTETSEAA